MATEIERSHAIGKSRVHVFTSLADSFSPCPFSLETGGTLLEACRRSAIALTRAAGGTLTAFAFAASGQLLENDARNRACPS